MLNVYYTLSCVLYLHTPTQHTHTLTPHNTHTLTPSHNTHTLSHTHTTPPHPHTTHTPPRTHSHTHTRTQGEPYFVRVSAYNMKGFGPARLADPPSAIPSSWHDIDSSQPRYEGKTDQMYALSAELNMMLSHSPPISPCKLAAL